MTLVQLGSCLNEKSRREMVKDGKSYRILGVKWYANGAWIKAEKNGNEIKAKYLYKVKSGDLVYNRLFAWKGAFAVIPDNLNNCYVSNEFPVFKVKDSSVNINFIFLYLSKPSLWDQIERQSSGVSSISRKRYKVPNFLNLEMYLPEIKRQGSIINGYRKIKKHQEIIQGLQGDNSSMCVKLRQAILQLAFQGKLVPQNSKDEPASVLLEKIKAEKERLIKEGKIKKSKPLPPLNPDEVPYALPKQWIWVRFGEIIDLISGQHIKSADYNSNLVGIGYLTGPSDFADVHPIITKWTEKPKTIAMQNDILLTVKGAGLGKNNIVDINKVAISRQLMAIRCNEVDYKYIHLFINSKYSYFQSIGVGIAIPGISRENVLALLSPLPPRNEQKRIVAKVDDLMALCDGLETSLSKSQTDCDRLMEAAVAEILAA